MKYLLVAIAVIIGSGLLFGKLASDFVDNEQQRILENNCKLTNNDLSQCNKL
jgi:hypothetical protein